MARDTAAPQGEAPLRVLLSKPVGASGTAALGRTHYSYGFAARNFTRMLKEAGAEPVEVPHPEQFKGPAFAAAVGLDGPAHPHLIFRSTEDIRPIHGAYNIACFAWEFDVLSGPRLGQDPVLGEQTTMLRLCDEIWAPCRFTEKVLHAHGFDNVRFVPSPVFPALGDRSAGKAAAWDIPKDALSCELVSSSSNFVVGGYDADIEDDWEALERRHAKPLGEQPKLKQVIEAGGRVFVSVLNTYDRRKNLANMIDGFLLAMEGRDDAVLVIKLITSGIVEKPAGYLYHQLRLILGRPHCVRDDRIILCGGFWTDEEMGALFNGADFYLCTTIAEGQNAPLLEAVRYGCLPVTTANTAMADYIDETTAVVIAEQRFSSLVNDLAADVAGRRYATDYADRFAVADAVTRALTLDDATIASLAARGFAVAKPGFWIEDVTPVALGRLREISDALARGEAPSAA